MSGGGGSRVTKKGKYTKGGQGKVGQMPNPDCDGGGGGGGWEIFSICPCPLSFKRARKRVRDAGSKIACRGILTPTPSPQTEEAEQVLVSAIREQAEANAEAGVEAKGRTPRREGSG